MGKCISRARLLWAAAVSVGLSSSAFGQFFTWTNAAGGTFNVAGNWNPAGPPTGVNQAAVYNLASSYAVTLSAGASHGTLLVNAGTVSLLAPSTVNYGVSTISLSGGSLSIGANVNLTASGTTTINSGARLSIENGATFAPSQNVIVNGGSLFRNSSNGSAFLLAAGRTLTVQAGGTASFTGAVDLDNSRTMTVTSGLISTTSFLDVGNGSTGTLVANGAAAQITSASTSFFGAGGGTGDVSFLGGSTGTFGSIQLGDATPASLGRLTVNGSTFACGNLSVGLADGAGEVALLGAGASLTVTGGAAVAVGSASAGLTSGSLTVSGGTFTTGTGGTSVNQRGLINLTGGTFNSLGTITVSGGTFSQTGGVLKLAPGATLLVQNGGTFSSTASLTLSQNQQANVTGGFLSATNGLNIGIGSDATITLSGTSSSQATQAVLIGGNGGTGTLAISGGATASFTSSLNVGAQATTAGNGFLSIDSGAQVTTGIFNVAASSGTSGSVTINSGTITASTVTIGSGGLLQLSSGGRLNLTGTLLIDGGVLQRNTFASAAVNQSTGQTITIRNNGLFTGSGTISIPNGNLLTCNTGGDLIFNGSSDVLNVGQGTGTTGTLSVTDPGSTVRAGTSLGTIYIGRNGGSGTAVFANSAAGTTNFLEIGDAGGNGTLSVTGGAQIVADSFELTRNGNGTAVVTIDGAGSRVDAQGIFADGSSTLTVSNGGALVAGSTTNLNISRFTINAGTADLGFLNNHTGTITLISGLLKFTANLNSGSTGLLGPSPTLTLGQRVDVGGNLVLEPASAVTLNGGEIDCFDITPAGGSFVWNSGTLNFTSNPGPAISASGPLGGDVTLPAARALGYANRLTIAADGALTVAGGRLTAPQFDIAGSLYYDGGPVSLGTGTVQSAGRVFVMPGRSLPVNGAITNAGRIEMFGSGARLTGAGAVINSGVITGDGEIAKSVLQSIGGEVRVDGGKRLAFTAGINTDGGGKITLGGGTFESTSAMLNAAPATITGRGTIKTAGLTNNGTLALSAGVSDVYGALTNQNAGKTIISGGATATFWDAVSNTGTSEFRISNASTAVFFGPVTGASRITGTGTAVFESTAAAGPLVNAGRSIVGPLGQLSATSVRQVGLTIEGQTALQPSVGGPAVSRLSELSIIGAPGDWVGSLDLGNNALLLDYTGASPLGTIANQIKQGFNNGAWNGTGISSTAAASQANRAIGFADANAIGSPAVFLGESIDSTTIILRYTLPGDADLSAGVNLDDFTRLAASFGLSSTWTGGDFNYDGVTNLDDFTALAANFGLSLPADPARSSVPEPVAGGLGIVLFGLAARRFRDHRR